MVLITKKLCHHESKSVNFLMLIARRLIVVVFNWFNCMPIKRGTRPRSAIEA